MKLFFDTETSDFPQRGGRIMQLGCLLTTNDGIEIASIDTLIDINPSLEVSPSAQAVHGISKEDCLAKGLNRYKAYDLFFLMASSADEIIAHNIQFDWAVMRAEAEELGRMLPSVPQICTMRSSTEVCNIPATDKMINAGILKPKSPKLSEALQILCGEELVKAHNAYADVQGCKKVYFKLKEMGEDLYA